jgi:DNA repair protein RadC
MSAGLRMPTRCCRRRSACCGWRSVSAPVLDAPATVRDFLRVRLGVLEHEVFSLLLLDAQNRLIEYVELFRGTVTQTSVYPREVVKEALVRNAAGVILVHNHPSGMPEPSRADEFLTQTLVKALALIDVRVLDHLVVTSADVMSFAERGLLLAEGASPPLLSPLKCAPAGRRRDQVAVGGGIRRRLNAFGEVTPLRLLSAAFASLLGRLVGAFGADFWHLRVTPRPAVNPGDRGQARQGRHRTEHSSPPRRLLAASSAPLRRLRAASAPLGPQRSRVKGG